MNNITTITFKPIGWVRTAEKAENIPHFYKVSEVVGTLDILPEFAQGLTNLEVGQHIIVLFHFHRSPPFKPEFLSQIPRQRNVHRGIFSICSPKRPNAIGLSVVEIIQIDGCKIRVKGLDMFDGTPILDIKPHTASKGDP